MPFEEHRVRELFQNRDRITFDEFCRIMQEFRGHHPEAYFNETFRAFDRNADGYITVKEIKKTMKDLGETLTDKQAKEMLKTADANGDGKLSREEFRTLFQYITRTASSPSSPSTETSPNRNLFKEHIEPQTSDLPMN